MKTAMATLLLMLTITLVVASGYTVIVLILGRQIGPLADGWRVFALFLLCVWCCQAALAIAKLTKAKR